MIRAAISYRLSVVYIFVLLVLALWLGRVYG